MKVRFVTLLAPLALAASALSAQATAHHGSDLSIGVRFGTLGIGPEVSKLVTSHIGLRVGANFFTYNRSIDQSDITFQGSFKLKAVTALVDLYPGNRGSFHVSAGIITNPASVTGTGVPSGSTFEINDQTFQSSDVGMLIGTASWPKTSPYFGLGFGTPAASRAGLKFVMDLGVAVGKAKVGLTATGAAANAQLQNALNAQVATIQSDLDKIPVYPVLQFGLVVRF